MYLKKKCPIFAEFLKMFRWFYFLKNSAYWIIPTTILIYLFYKYENNLIIDNKYIECAIKEAISPFLWNVLGVIGFCSAGISILLLSISTNISILFSKIAHKILSMTYEMGFLIFGIMVGKLILDFRSATMPTWQLWFYGVTFLFLFLIIFVLNMLLWMVDEIIINIEIQRTAGYDLINRLKSKSRWISIFIGLVIIILSISSLIFKRTT